MRCRQKKLPIEMNLNYNSEISRIAITLKISRKSAYEKWRYAMRVADNAYQNFLYHQKRIRGGEIL